jgi:hypothetical protein
MADPPPEQQRAPLLYHYTSVGAAVEILAHGEMWLSSTSAMNDSLDGRWLKKLVQDREAARQATSPRSADEAVALDVMQHVVFESGAPQAYISCFSEKPDLLSQWRGYAADGRGVAIGFDLNVDGLDLRLGPPFTTAAPKGQCALTSVDYVDQADLSDLFDRLDEVLAAGQKGGDFFPMQLELTARRWTAKNPAFAEEHEWRIVNLPMQFTGDIGGGHTSISEVGQRQFRVRGERLVSYYRFPFPEGAVREIVLGPQNEVDPIELRLFLHQHDLDHVPCRRSNATYRS